MPQPGLRRLLMAAELCRERDLAVLKRIDAEAAALRAEAQALRELGADGGARLAMRGEATRIAASWDAARDRRLTALAMRLAELAVRREAARAGVARSTGRLAAIRKLGESRGRRGQAS